MKTLLLLLSTALAACAQPAFPTNVTITARGHFAWPLTWQAGSDETFTNYTAFIGTAPGVRATNDDGVITASGYHLRADTGTNTQLQVTNLGTGTFYGVLTATTDEGRTSNPTDEFTFTAGARRPPPATPKQIKTVSLRVRIEGADHLQGPWKDTTNFPPLLALVARPQRFYRVALDATHGPQISTGR